MLFRSSPGAGKRAEFADDEGGSSSGAGVVALWIFYPALASVLLLATTNAINQWSAVIPFLWILPLTALLLALVQESVARLGVVTGQGLSDLIRERFGVRWALFAMIVLLLANLANTVANVAGAASALAIFDVPVLLTAPLAALTVWLLVVYGTYRSVERIFLALTAVFLAYIAAALLAQPNWTAVATSITSPNLGGISAAELLLVVAVVGTTVTP